MGSFTLLVLFLIKRVHAMLQILPISPETRRTSVFFAFKIISVETIFTIVFSMFADSNYIPT